MTAERREATHTYDPALYVLVPREPTPEMCAAGERVIQHEGAHRPGRTFRRIQAAIAAAPPPPADVARNLNLVPLYRDPEDSK